MEDNKIENYADFYCIIKLSKVELIKISNK